MMRSETTLSTETTMIMTAIASKTSAAEDWQQCDETQIEDRLIQQHPKFGNKFHLWVGPRLALAAGNSGNSLSLSASEIGNNVTLIEDRLNISNKSSATK